MYLWGLTAHRLANATRMWREGLAELCHAAKGSLRQDTQGDWVYDVLLRYLREESERIAGLARSGARCVRGALGRLCGACADGFWHLHDATNVPAIHQHVVAEWNVPEAAASRPDCKTEPTEDMVRRILQRDFPFVRQFRKGEVRVCANSSAPST